MSQQLVSMTLDWAWRSYTYELFLNRHYRILYIRFGVNQTSSANTVYPCKINITSLSSTYLSLRSNTISFNRPSHSSSLPNTVYPLQRLTAYRRDWTASSPSHLANFFIKSLASLAGLPILPLSELTLLWTFFTISVTTFRS